MGDILLTTLENMIISNFISKKFKYLYIRYKNGELIRLFIQIEN